MDLLNEYIHVDSWSAARGLLSQQPELLSEQAEAFLSEEMDYYKQRGSANIAAGLAVFQAVLRRARVEGMDAALGGLLKDSVTRSFGLLTELVEAGTVEWDVLVFLEAWEDLALTATPIGAVHELFAGTSWDRLGQILRRRHELLERDAVDLVERLASFACKQEDHVACWVLQTVSRLLQDYQAAGVDETLAAWTSVPDAARPAGGHEGIVLPLELALLLGRRALMLLRQEVPAEAAARAWHELGMVYTKRVRGNRADNLEQAISCYHSGLAVLPRKVAPDRRASLLHDLGVCYAQRERGNPADNVERAIRCYAEALKVFDREASPLLWATTQASLGDAYLRARDDGATNIEQALACYQAALDMLTPDAEPQVWAFARLGQALAYERRARGDLFDNIERAMACYRTVLEAFTLEHAPHYWAMAQAALGRLMARHWRLRPRSEWIEEAITHLTASLRVFGPRTFPLEWATVQVVLAGVHLLWTGSGPRSHAEDVEQAITHAEAALEVFTQEAFPFEWAEAQERLGLAYMERQRGITVQNVEQAIAHFRSALTVFAPERAPERQLEIAAALGAAYSQLGRWNAAVAVYRDAIDANELLYATAVLPAARQARMAKDSPIYIQAAYAMVCAATCQQQRAPQQRLLVEAIETIERNRAIVLGEALEHDAAEVHEAARHAPDAHAAFLAAVRRLRELESLELSFEQLGEVAPVYETDILRRVMLQGGDLLPPATWEGLPRGLPPEWWVNLRDAARGASKALHAALERIRSQPGLEGFLRGLAWEDLAGMVQPNEALVYLVTSEAVAPSFALLIIGSARDTGAASVPEVEVVKTHAFTHDDLERILARGSPDGSMSGLLPGTLDGNGQALRAALDEALPLVGAALIGPLAEQLTRHQVARATLVPCGRLATLPLHAATYQRAGDERPRCLLDEFDIAYAPSAKVLAATRAALPAKEAASRVLAAVVNPLPNPKPLPFAGLEVKAIADSVPPPAGFAAVRILQEQAATVAALLEAAQGASHVHLACHGSFVLHRPLGSELRLANGSRITLRELVDSSWFRDARLIVAAACQTALVDLGWARPLDEVIGWPAGFLRAGAPGVVGALWPVDDLACALLMPRFYRYHLLGDPPSGAGPMSPAGALRRAQQDLAKLTTSDVAAYLAEQLGLANPDLADTDRLGAKAAAFEAIQAASPSSGEPERPFAHPAEWAAFVLVGT